MSKANKLYEENKKLNKVTFKNFIASGKLRQKTIKYKKKLEKELKITKSLLSIL